MNPLIALSGKPMQFQEPESRLNSLARVLQVKAMADQSDMHRLQADELRRNITENASLNEAYKGALGTDGAVDRTRLLSLLATGGLGAKIPSVQKQFLEADKAGAELGKTRAETGKLDLDATIKKAEHAASVLSLAKDQQSYDTVRRSLGSHAAGMPAQFDPNYVQAQIAQGMTIVQRLADQRQRDVIAETNRHNTTTEGETGRHNRSSEGIQYGQLGETRRHNTSMEGFRGKEVAQGQTQIINDPVRGPMVVSKRTGAALPVTMGGQAVPGEVPAKQQMAAQKTLPNLDAADKLIDQATGSYIGAGVDATARAFGSAPAGAEAIAKLRVLEGQIMMSQPRMEGPQSDKDVQLYRQMAGQIGDPTVPRDVKKAALATIRDIQTRYAGGSATAASAAGGLTAAEQAELQQLRQRLKK